MPDSPPIERHHTPQDFSDRVAYWSLAPDARLRDVIIAVRADETQHRNVNHRFADELES